MSSITSNDVGEYKNVIKAVASIVCERMKIRKSAKPQQDLF